MKYELACQTAERLGVTVRAVQKWAQQGKLAGAKKVGRDWMIPVGIKQPGNSSDTNVPLPTRTVVTVLPFLTASFEKGKALEFIDDIEDTALHDLALSEYHYLLGEFDEASLLAEPYLNHENPALRLSSALVCVFANISGEFMHKTHLAAKIVEKELAEFLHPETAPELLAIAVLAAMIIKLQFHLPIGKVPDIEPLIKYLPEGHKVLAFYLMAYRSYHKKNYEHAIGIATAALCMTKGEYSMGDAHLYIISAMCLMNLKRIDEAYDCIERAWALCHADNFIMPFVEHYSLLQGTIELYFKKHHPVSYQKILRTAKNYNIGWYEIYNKQSGKTVADNLTLNELTIAMLYSRNWRAKEIAEHIGVSERTITNYIQIIYEKLNINGKAELYDFMLH